MTKKKVPPHPRKERRVRRRNRVRGERERRMDLERNYKIIKNSGGVDEERKE